MDEEVTLLREQMKLLATESANCENTPDELATLTHAMCEAFECILDHAKW